MYVISLLVDIVFTTLHFNLGAILKYNIYISNCVQLTFFAKTVFVQSINYSFSLYILFQFPFNQVFMILRVCKNNIIFK